ncbi:MAG: alpha-glucan family phosphorylase [Thermodesulfobacteriota bacterium]|nr:alpha-glucan family phosphorylase [Thermodesulfobacteriota bacterium]
MSFLQTFQVFPYVPKPLKFLEVLSRNMWWCWNMDAIDLFRRIDPKSWDAAGRNPITFSSMISQKRMEELAQDDSFLAHLERVQGQFESQVDGPMENDALSESDTIAYFSMEFGIHESLPQFAGGLGILAGDHMKAASDLRIPIVGVGLFYRSGYFHQYLNHEGWQQESYPEIDLFHLPIERARDATGNELRLTVAGPDGDIRLVVWRLNVGRITLYLLDTNIKENPQQIRDINSHLYRSDSNVRLAQEVILGIGGMRALDAMGIYPTVCHLNEGHCSFLSIERLRQIMEKQNVDLKTAIEICSRSTVFTTHTPVPAGHDEFTPDAVKPYLAPLAQDFGIPVEELLSWGQIAGASKDSPFSMFVLGLRLAQYCNGVSELHGSVARKMWAYVWPGRPEEEVPISHVTNGAHIPSWISIENSLLFERYLEPEWHLNAWKGELTKRIDNIYDEELWRAHEMSRTRLIRSCRKLMVNQYGRRNAPKSVMRDAESVLDQDVLTIAFARRFATYKRATLLLQDMDRFEALLRNKEQPVQFIFSGKAHPRDNEGKTLIQRIVELARNAEFRHKVIFLEDYDINVARHLVQGADVWLNTPRRPFEACGTSGMKAAANGVLNVSILDGWWCEGYSPETGWAIGDGQEYEDYNYQDAVESQALYNILENDVIPCFYDRESGDLPVKWLKMMKASMRMAIEYFCAHRMVDNYLNHFYIPAVNRFYELTKDDAAEAMRLTVFHERLRKKWGAITIEPPVRHENGPFRVGEAMDITSDVYLGDLKPEEVKVELYYGRVKNVEALMDGQTLEMSVKESLDAGKYRYECSLPCQRAGRFGFTVRITPRGDDLITNTPGLITWA